MWPEFNRGDLNTIFIESEDRPTELAISACKHGHPRLAEFVSGLQDPAVGKKFANCTVQFGDPPHETTLARIAVESAESDNDYHYDLVMAIVNIGAIDDKGLNSTQLNSTQLLLALVKESHHEKLKRWANSYEEEKRNKALTLCFLQLAPAGSHRTGRGRRAGRLDEAADHQAAVEGGSGWSPPCPLAREGGSMGHSRAPTEAERVQAQATHADGLHQLDLKISAAKEAGEVVQHDTRAKRLLSDAVDHAALLKFCEAVVQGATANLTPGQDPSTAEKAGLEVLRAVANAAGIPELRAKPTPLVVAGDMDTEFVVSAAAASADSLILGGEDFVVEIARLKGPLRPTFSSALKARPVSSLQQGYTVRLPRSKTVEGAVVWVRASYADKDKDSGATEIGGESRVQAERRKAESQTSPTPDEVSACSLGSAVGLWVLQG